MDPPVKPDESECCNSGCHRCILDVYEEQVKRYEAHLKNVSKETDTFQDKNCISPCNYTPFNLTKIEKHTVDTFLYTFKYLQSKGDVVLCYKPGQHFYLKGYDEKTHQKFTRAYTPICKEGTTFTILVRLYKDGIMSSYLRNLELGQETLWRGPYCDFPINISSKNMLFVAQGTGIAPIYALIKHILSDDNCYVFLHLLFCCRNKNDILLRKDLYDFKSHWNFQYQVFLNDTSDSQCKYKEVLHRRKLTNYDLQAYLGSKERENLQVFVCGSEQFEKCIQTYLSENGVTKNVVVFK